MRTSKTAVTVTSRPLDGSPGQTLLEVPVPAGRSGGGFVEASAQGVAALVTTAGKGGAQTTQLYSGPAGAPLAPVGPAQTTAPFASGITVAGDTVLVGDGKGTTTAVEADGSTSVPPALPEASSHVAYAGDFVAFGLSDSAEQLEEHNPDRVGVARWRTGERVRTVDLPSGLLSLDLREDGAVVLQMEKGLATLSPAGDVTPLRADGYDPVWAGERIVVTRDYLSGTVVRTFVIEPDGTTRRIGIASRTLTDVFGGTGDVVTRSHGCVLVTPITDGPADGYRGEGCPAAEAYVPDSRRAPLARVIPVPVSCLNAQTGVCTGQISGREVRGKRFRVPAGQRRVFRVRLTPQGWNRVRNRRRAVIHLRRPSGGDVFLRRP